MAMIHWFRSRRFLHKRLNSVLFDVQKVTARAERAEHATDDYKRCSEAWQEHAELAEKNCTELRLEKVALANSCRSYKAANTTYRTICATLSNANAELRQRIDGIQGGILTDYLASTNNPLTIHEAGDLPSVPQSHPGAEIEEASYAEPV